jgi:hypothetical protein
MLGDPNYMKNELFIMKRIGRWEVARNSNLDFIQSYNKMHENASGVGYWRLEKKMEETHENNL